MLFIELLLNVKMLQTQIKVHPQGVQPCVCFLPDNNERKNNNGRVKHKGQNQQLDALRKASVFIVQM